MQEDNLALMKLSWLFNLGLLKSVCWNTRFNVCNYFVWLIGCNLCLCISCVWRFPLYYEIKIACVIWLVSPYTRGASVIYRKILHPLLTSKERVIMPFNSWILIASTDGFISIILELSLDIELDLYNSIGTWYNCASCFIFWSFPQLRGLMFHTLHSPQQEYNYVS